MNTYAGPVVAVIYEDDVLLAVNKPAGLVVHGDGRTEEPTLTEWVLARHPGLAEVGGLHTLDSGRYAPRAGIVHRLDRETSGVVLIAKNDAAFWVLQRQFIAHTVAKVYLALCLGAPLSLEGAIDLPIGRSRVDFRQWAVAPVARGTLRAAHTVYRLVAQNNMYSLVEFRPKTGRTHQLRVHAKAAGFPIICDARYGTPAALGFTRLALHAEKIDFEHPSSGLRVEIIAPLPKDFTEAMKEIGVKEEDRA